MGQEVDLGYKLQGPSFSGPFPPVKLLQPVGTLNIQIMTKLLGSSRYDICTWWAMGIYFLPKAMKLERGYRAERV